MIVTRPIYYIIFKDRPIQFLDEGCNPTSYFEEAYGFDKRIDAECQVAKTNEPDLFEIIEGKFEVEI